MRINEKRSTDKMAIALIHPYHDDSVFHHAASCNSMKLFEISRYLYMSRKVLPVKKKKSCLKIDLVEARWREVCDRAFE